MYDIVKCARCRNTLVGEAFKDHICTPRFRGSERILIDYYCKTRDDEGREIIQAKGMDGIIYSLIVSNTESVPLPFDPSAKRTVTEGEPNGDVTEPASNMFIYKNKIFI